MFGGHFHMDRLLSSLYRRFYKEPLDVVVPLSTLIDQCVQAKDDAGKQRLMSADYYMKAYSVKGNQRLIMTEQCAKATTNAGIP